VIQVELVYDTGCPNVPEARRVLMRAFAAVNLTPRWDEWERGAAASPEYVRDFGSPTILVNGADVAAAPQVAGAGACRIYQGENGALVGVPPMERVAASLMQACTASAPAAPQRAATFKEALPTLPTIGVALLPKLTCPACWPAYAGLLSAMGFGFVNYTPYLLPLMAVFLVLTLATLAYRARVRRGFGPFAVGSLAAMIVLIGKFWLDSDTALYAGIALLVGASLWNAWPKAVRSSCPACFSDKSHSINEHELDGGQIK
jgi:mercuric ion transport protein